MHMLQVAITKLYKLSQHYGLLLLITIGTIITYYFIDYSYIPGSS